MVSLSPAISTEVYPGSGCEVVDPRQDGGEANQEAYKSARCRGWRPRQLAGGGGTVWEQVVADRGDVPERYNDGGNGFEASDGRGSLNPG